MCVDVVCPLFQLWGVRTHWNVVNVKEWWLLTMIYMHIQEWKYRARIFLAIDKTIGHIGCDGCPPPPNIPLTSWPLNFAILIQWHLLHSFRSREPVYAYYVSLPRPGFLLPHLFRLVSHFLYLYTHFQSPPESDQFSDVSVKARLR